MNKVALKTRIAVKQNGKDLLTAEKLGTDVSLFDTHRFIPKHKGGIYTDENTGVVTPITHMKEHGIYRERTPEELHLKALIDGREQTRKILNSMNNRLMAERRKTDKMDDNSREWIEGQIKIVTKQLSKKDREIEKYLKTMNLPILSAMKGVKGTGLVTKAYLLIYLDIKKADHASSFWAYCGYDKPSHSRYQKNISGGGNKTLRTALYTWAESNMRTKSVYKDVYDREKKKLEVSEKMVISMNTQGKLIECAWKDAKPSHRHGAAMRKMIKHFLADLWFVWRTVEGLPTTPLYAEAVLGHKSIIRPEERGWKY